MNNPLPFTKMHGAGNDYIYINAFVENISRPDELAKKMSDRHFGIGSDGLVLLLPSAVADIRMRMFNSDGSEAEMCGNASRCICKFAHDLGIVEKTRKDIRLETASGIRDVALIFRGDEVVGATVDMGRPRLLPAEIPLNLDLLQDRQADKAFISQPVEIDGRHVTLSAVSMGNPHAVVLVENPAGLNLECIGPRFERNQLFPKKTNTEFIEVLGPTRIKMRVWERGAGETLACGTGACAAVVACALNGYTGPSVDVELSGGVLHIEWNRENDHVYMTGNAVTVFDGHFFHE